MAVKATSSVTLMMVSDGAKGSDGKGISTIIHHYLVTNVTTGITTNTTGWKTSPSSVTTTNKYLWYYQTINYTTGSPTNTMPAIIGVYGDTGGKGETGKGIKSVTPEYYLSTSNTTQTGGSWKTTQDTWVSGRYYWTRDSINWNDGSTTTTTPTLATGLNNANSTANNAQTIANQTASKFQWIVKSGNSATDFTLTDRTAQLVADSINLKGLVTFKGLDSSTQNKINNTSAYTDAMQEYGYQYNKELVIKGDVDKYYPVIIYHGNQDKMRDIQVSRNFGATHPSEWNGHPTNKGIALNLKIKCSFGNWGGATYKHFITDFSEEYGHVFAGCVWVADYMGYAIFLRGGGEDGAYYMISSDQPLTTKFRMDSQKREGCIPHYDGSKDLLGNYGEQYKWYAPEPRVYSDTIAKEIADMYTEEVAKNANDKIDNLQIGGRNLILNSDTWSGINTNHGTGITSSIEDGVLKIISNTDNGDYNRVDRKNVIEEKLNEGDSFTFAIEIKSDNGTVPPRVYFKEGLGYFNLKGKVSSNYSWCYYTGTWKKANSIALHFGWYYAIGTYYIRKIKFEKGNKPTDWTPAPEDKANQSIIDNWSKDDVVGDETTINGGYIKTNTIKTDQLAVGDIFSTGNAVMNIINSQEINANRITSGKITSKSIDAYGLSILDKDRNIETFSIASDGQVMLRGSVESYDYISGKTGWSINYKGSAEFNDVTVRGGLITGDGGIASSGGLGVNLQKNTSFYNGLNDWAVSSNVWSVDKSVKYNGINSLRYSASNLSAETISSCTTQAKSISAKSGDTFTAQATFYTDNLSGITGTKPKFKIIFYNTAGTVLHEKEVTVSFINKQWVLTKITATAPANTVYVGISFIGYLNGTFYISQPKIEEGNSATEWSLSPNDKGQVPRFWAGTTYENREYAPFIVYNDGSLKAAKGTFGGVFTGDIKIGNVSITDPNVSNGDDATITVINGNTGVKAVQLTDMSQSSFAQDISITDNFYNEQVRINKNGVVNALYQFVVGNIDGTGNERSILTKSYLQFKGGSIVSSDKRLTVERANSFDVGSISNNTDLTVYGVGEFKKVLKITKELNFNDTVKCIVSDRGIDFNFYDNSQTRKKE